MRKLLVDADLYAYHFATAGENRFYFDEEPAVVTDFPAAQAAFRKWLRNLCELLDTPDYVLAFSDPTRRYFRHNILPTYKQHRTQGTVPVLLPEMKAWMKETFVSKTIDHLEADDIVGIMATMPGGEEHIVVGSDKDLRTIPAQHYNPSKSSLGVQKVSQAQADYNHLYQTLTGDSCDGYKGCPFVGPKKAAKILALDNFPILTSPAEVLNLRWIAVVETFEQRGLTAADALVQAQVARICRASDWDFKERKVIPWKPPSVS